MADSRLAFDIFARDDGASAVLDKVARAADKTGVSLKKTAKVSDDVAKSSANLTKAHNRESDALDKVQIAEQKLTEVRGNSNSKTSQIIVAEKALSKARRDAAVAGNVAQKAAKDLGAALDNEGKKAGKSLGGSLRKWFTGDGKNVFKQVGEDGGTVFGSGLLGALKTPILGPAIVVTVGAAVATAAPAVGAIAGAGIVTGFGAGIAALGLVFAAKSKDVQDKWKSTMSQLGADMKLMSTPFESTLIRIADIFKRTVDKFNPALAASFQKMAVPIQNFADQAGRALEKLVPAIGPISDAFNAVLDATGPALQDAVSSLANGLIKLANSVKQNPKALADLVKGLGDIVGLSLNLITILNNVNSSFSKLTGGTSLVTVAMRALQFPLLTIAGPFAVLNRALELTNALLGKTGKDFDGAGQSMSAAANKTVLLAQGLRTAGDGAVHAGSGLNGLAGAAGRSAHETHAANVAASLLAGAYDRQAAATQRSIDALNRQSDLLLSLSGAEIGYQQAVDDATAAIKANGKTHDLNTQKGRDNQRALDAVTASAKTQRDALLKAGDGNVKAAKAAETGRAAFIRLAVQMGYSKTQAQAMAQSLIKIPNVTRTAKLNANKKDLETKLAEAQTALKNPNLTKERRAKLTADIANAKSGIATIDRMLGNLPKSKTITINTYKNLLETVTHQDIGVRAPGRAVGGPVQKGMPYIVGEHRPELFVPKESGTIIPRVPGRARGAAFAASGGGTTININVNGALDPVATAKQIQQLLLNLKRTNRIELGLA